MLLAALTIFLPGRIQAQETTDKATKDSKAAQQAVSGTDKNCPHFIDNDGNGICDNFEKRGQAGRGTNFTDKDGDGICDHRAGMMKQDQGNKDRSGLQRCCDKQSECCGRGPCNGRGKGMGYQHRHGCGGPCGERNAAGQR